MGLEIRKSLSTRSGLALAGAAVLLAPAAVAIAAGTASEHLDNVLAPAPSPGKTLYRCPSINCGFCRAMWGGRSGSGTLPP